MKFSNRLKRHTVKYISQLLIFMGCYRQLADFNYYRTFKKRINWKSPEDLNQWINWLSFNSDTSLWPMFADKLEVRKFVKNNGFEENLVPLLAKWENPEAISFENLPDQFVLKANNGSGDVCIITDKRNCNIKEIRKYFKSILQKPFGKESAEPHYLKIKPYVIAEALLEKDKQAIKSSSLVDYKFWCFNGKPVCCWIAFDRNKDNLTMDLYSADDKWNKIEDGKLVYNQHHLKSNIKLPKPEKLNEMLEIVSTLSKGIPQVRIDLYEVDGKVYFGEMTLTSLSGRMNYFTNDYLKMLGAECGYAVEKLKIREK